jgi:hypothetical protein
MRMLLFVLGVLLAVSCESKTGKIDLVKYQGREQLLTINDVKRNGEKLKEPRIISLSKDSILVGEELLVKIFLEEADLKLIDAFLNCKSVENPAVDTMTYKVSGCSRGLIVQNDTIFIGFHPTKSGVQKFSEITILTKDKENIFRTFKYSFEYKVKGRM